MIRIDKYLQSGMTFGEAAVARAADRAAKKEARQKALDAVKNGPVAKAIAPLRDFAMDSAEDYAKRVVKKVREELKKVNWDINAVAPYPKAWDMNRNDYMTALSKHNTFSLVTKWREAVHRDRNAPLYVDMDPEAIKDFIEDARKSAALQYDAYAEKLMLKIGPTAKEATLTSGNEETGENLWHYSLLQVKMSNGKVQNWKTKMIFNVSKLGKVFNQFPTRQIKLKGGM